MKKTFSILLSIVMLFSIIAITVSAADVYDPADYDYAYKLLDYMSGNANAGSGTAKLTSDEIDFTVEGGLLTKYSDYSNSGYKGFAQWNNNNNNRKLTIALKNIASGTYKLTIFSADNSSSRGIFDVAASGTSLGTVSFIAKSATFVKHELDATFTTDGTSPVEITFVPTADATSKQAFLYSFGLTKVDGGESQEPESSTVTETTTTTTTTTTVPTPSTPVPDDADTYSYVIFDNMATQINPPGKEAATVETDNMVIKVVGGALGKNPSYRPGYDIASWNNSSENVALEFGLKNVPAGEYALTLISADNNTSRGVFDVVANDVALGEVNCLNTVGVKITEHAFATTFKADGRKNVEVTVTPTETTEKRQIYFHSIVLTKVADYVPTPEVAITMVEGAQLRFNEFIGMRYRATVDAAAVAAYEAEGYDVEMGTLISPADIIGSFDALTFEAGEDNYLNVVTTGYYATSENEIAGSIVNIKETNVGRNYIARSYVKLTAKDGSVYVSYATENDNTRSVKFLAKAVIDDDALPANTAQVALIKKWAVAADFEIKK